MSSCVARKSKNKPAPAAVEVLRARKRGGPRRARSGTTAATDGADVHGENDILEAEAHLIAEEDLPASPSLGGEELRLDTPLDHAGDDIHSGNHNTFPDGSDLPAHPLVPL